MSEPFLTNVMPLYASASWIAILLSDKLDHVIFSSATFGAIWALYNTIVVSGSLDLGLVTMGFVAVTVAFDLFVLKKASKQRVIKYTVVVGSLLVSVNFCIPFLIWSQLKEIFRSEPLNKSPFWFRVFPVYLATMAIFWLYVAFKVLTRREGVVNPTQYRAMHD